MKRKVLGLLCGVMLWAGAWPPGQAQEVPGGSSVKPETPASKADPQEGNGQLPSRLAAFLAGVVIGTPIAIVRRSVAQTVNATHDIVGDSTNPLFVLPAGALSLPFAVLGGTLEGAYMGPLNAWVHSSDEPFGKDSFSLGEMK